MQPRILIVDDSKMNRKILSKTLSSTYVVIEAENGFEALETLNKPTSNIDAVLLDILMPVMNGYEFLEKVRTIPRFKDLPIVVMTGDAGGDSEKRALSLGAWDFVPKPYDPEILFFRLKNAIDRSLLSAFSRIKHMAEYDLLTDVFNRNKLYENAQRLIDNVKDTPFVFVRFDIDRFKLYNDIFGSKKGDELLIALAKKLKSVFNTEKHSAFGRIEADHFAALVPADSFNIDKHQKDISSWLTAFNSNFKFTPRFGIYVIKDADVDISLISDRSLLALRSLKQNYSTMVAFYDDSMRRTMLEEQEIINEMADALKDGQFDIYLQPQYNHAHGELVGAEALVRWFHPKKGMIAPYKFIPIFEKNGFISRLDEYVWERACIYLRKWSEMGLNPIPVSVNISRVDIYNPRLVDTIVGLTNRYNIEPKLLHLEITESAYMESPEQLIDTVQRLREKGFFVEMDDFGSGYSSLNSLKQVPVDLIKLDLRFLTSTDINGRGGIILSSVVRMAHWLNLPIIAEGVETVKQADYLKSIGCELVQGYLYAKPMSVADYENLLSRSSTSGQFISFKIADFFNTAEFWDPQSQSAVIFNSFIGAAGIYEFYDDQLEALRVNDRFYDELSLSRSSFKSHLADFINYIFPDDKPKFLAMINNAVLSGDEFNSETRWNLSTQGTTPTWLRIRSRAIARSDSRYIIYASIENVTELKKAMHELELQRYSQALCSIYDEIYEIDYPANKISVIVSPHGIPGSDEKVGVLDRNLRDLCSNYVYSHDRQALYDFVMTACSSQNDESRKTFEYRFITPERKIRWYSIVLLNTGSGKYLLCSADVTERKEAEQLIEDNAALHAAQKEQDMYRIIFELTGNITVIDVDYTKNSLYTSESYKLYVLSRYDIRKLKSIPLPKNMVHPDDESLFSDYIHDFKLVTSSLVVRMGMVAGGYRWCKLMQYIVFDSEGGRKRMMGIILDIDDELHAKEELNAAEKKRHWQDERNRILIESTNAIIYEYDPVRDKLTYTLNSPNFGLNEITYDNYVEKLESFTCVHHDSLAVYRATLLSACKKVCSGTLEYLANYTGSGYRWSRAYYVSVADESGYVYRVVGRVDDIQEERSNEMLRREIENTLREKAETDSGTGLLNKGSLQNTVDSQLSMLKDNSCGLLFIMDVDNFKMVNDMLGHLYGDSFLRDAATTLKKIFSHSDPVGRIGGDEFAAYTQVLCSDALENANKIAQQIVDNISNINVPILGSVKCSIGVSIVSSKDELYKDAIEKADRALYAAKGRGKNCYAIYDNSLLANEDPDIPCSCAERTEIDLSHSARSVRHSILEHIFRLLYDSSNIVSAIESILEVLGKCSNVDRTYIFEDTDDGLYCNNTFEWCNVGIEHEKANLQMLSYENDLGNTYKDNFDADGIFYCHDITTLPKQQYDILEAQGIQSMLQCALVEDGNYRGFIGFDDCKKNCDWSQENIEMLTFTSKMIGTFLLRKRDSDKVVSVASMMRQILDNYDAFIYIIDPTNFEIKFTNKSTNSMLCFDPAGMYCYKAILHKDSPCENCPAKKLIQTNEPFQMEIYNDIMNVWGLAKSSWLDWNGKKMILISCVDITAYKKN